MINECDNIKNAQLAAQLEYFKEYEAGCRFCESFDFPYCIHPKYQCFPLHLLIIYCKGFIREPKNIN
jgi:hypothetical protein